MLQDFPEAHSYGGFIARSVAPHNHLCLTLSLVLEIPPKMIRMCQFMTCPIPRADISGPPVFSPWPPPLSQEKSAVLLPHRSVLAPLLYFFTQGSLSLSQVYCSPSQTFTQMSERGLGTDLYCSSSPAIYRKISPPQLGVPLFQIPGGPHCPQESIQIPAHNRQVPSLLSSRRRLALTLFSSLLLFVTSWLLVLSIRVRCSGASFLLWAIQGVLLTSLGTCCVTP